MTRPLLEVAGLVAGYVPDLPIVQGVSLSVHRGEVVTIIGPNGAGKSTLVKAVAGLVRVSAGSVRLDGADVTNIETHRMAAAGMAYVPQTGNVFATLTVHENLMVGAHTLGAERHERIAEAYRAFPDLVRYRDQKGRVLSGGQRQMLAVARALLTRPSLLILDEPTAGLAPIVVREVFERLRALAASGVAVLMVEQNAKGALRASDRAYVLAEGRNRASGPAAELLEDPVVGEIYLGGRRVSA